MWRTYLLGPLLALLPRPWRLRVSSEIDINWTTAGIISGFFELMLFLGLLAWWYFRIIMAASGQQEDVLVDGMMRHGSDAPGYGAAIATGFSSFMFFMIHPVTWVLAAHCIEGLLRTLAVIYSETLPGTMTLAAIERGVRAVRARVYERTCPRVIDHVVRPTPFDRCDLLILSCRPKHEWSPGMTIRYKGHFLRVLSEEVDPERSPGRQYVYRVRRPQPGEAFRRIVDYDPADVTKQPERSPNFLIEELRRIRKKLLRNRKSEAAPHSPDRITLVDGEHGLDLTVECSEPKPLWEFTRTIQFEDRLYRITARYDIPDDGRTLYKLTALAPGEAARGTIQYTKVGAERCDARTAGAGSPADGL